MSAASQAEAGAGLPSGVSFEDAEKIAQGDMAAIDRLVARFSNKILPYQPDFIGFFVELPEMAWRALRQRIVDTRIPIRDIDAKVREERLRRVRGAGKDWRRSACFKVALELRAGGAAYETVRDALLKHEDQEVADWGRDSGEFMLRRIYESACPEKDLLLSDFVAHMPSQKIIYKPTCDLWPAASVDARVPPCEMVDQAGNPIIGVNGEPIQELASVWLAKHAAVEQVTWAPREPEIIHGKLLVEGGSVIKEGAAAFNLYKAAPPLPPGADAAKAEKWIDLLEKIYPDDALHITSFFAHCAQRPDKKINHGLVLGGPPGIGKDTLLEALRRTVGPWNFQEVSPQQMMGPFNGYLKGVVLRISEAKDMGDVDRYKFYAHTKTAFAAPPYTLRINEKNLREYYVLNVCAGVMTTNHLRDGIYLPADDRRYYVAWSNAKQADFQAEHWNDFWRWYEREGFGHVAAYLREFDLSGFDPKAPPPKTAAFWAIVDANHPSEDAELADLIDALKNPHAVTRDQLLDAADKAEMFGIAEWLKDRKNRRIVSLRLEKCGYVPVRNDDADDGLFKVGARRKVIYARTELPLSDRFAAARRLAGVQEATSAPGRQWS
jgi:hypothetical protein